MKYKNINDVISFVFTTSDSFGNAVVGSIPTVKVRSVGGLESAVPVYLTTANLLTDSNYPAGSWEVSIPATEVNDFMAGGEYVVLAEAVIDAVTVGGIVGEFALATINANISSPVLIQGTIQKLDDLQNLSPAEITAAVPSVAAIEAALLNDGDGQQLLQAILDKINSDIDLPSLELAAISDAVRTNLAVEMNAILTLLAAHNGSGLNTNIDLTGLQSAVNDIPTNPLATNDSRLDYLNAAIATRSSHSAADVVAAMEDVGTKLTNASDKVDALKAASDTGDLGANIQKVNDVLLTGDGLNDPYDVQ